MYESEPSLPTPHPTPHTCAHTHSQTHTHKHTLIVHTLCVCVCVCVYARAHACVCRCGVRGIQNYVYILFLKFYVRIFLDLVKCSVPILIGEISAITVTTITLLLRPHSLFYVQFACCDFLFACHGVCVCVCVCVCMCACMCVPTVFLFKSMN